MKLYVYSLEKPMFEGEAVSVSLPTEAGEITVLNQHVPLVTTLAPGTIRIKQEKGADVHIPLTGGYGEVSRKKMIVLMR